MRAWVGSRPPSRGAADTSSRQRQRAPPASKSSTAACFESTQQMAVQASAAEVERGGLLRTHSPSKRIAFPIELGTLLLPVRSHAWAHEAQHNHQEPERGQNDPPPVAPELCEISWEEGGPIGYSTGQQRGRPRKLVLHRPRSGAHEEEPAGSKPTGEAKSGNRRASKTNTRTRGARVANPSVAPDLEEDLALDQCEEEELAEGWVAPSSVPEPKGANDRRSYSSLKYSKDDEEYVPRTQRWGDEESSDDDAAVIADDRRAAAQPAGRRPPMTSDGRPLVTRRHKTAADWEAEMDRAVANRGAWRGGRVAFAGGDSDSEESNDDWAGASTGEAESSEEEDDEVEEKGDPLYTCTVEASDVDHTLHALLRHLYALCEIGWIKLSATLLFSTQAERIQRPAFQAGPQGLRGVATQKIQNLYFDSGMLPKPEQDIIERTSAAVSLTVTLLEAAVCDPASHGRHDAKYRKHQKFLRVVIDALLHHVPPPGFTCLNEHRLRLGPASDSGLNVGHVSGTDWDEAVVASQSDNPEEAMRPFTVAGLLEAIEADSDLPLATVPEGLRTTPLPYQRQAVSWMLHREALAADVSAARAAGAVGVGSGGQGAAPAPPAPPAPAPAPPPPPQARLHPVWDQLVAADGQVLYAHRMTGQLDLEFVEVVRGSTCGGCLCDEVGLGKTLEVLYLTLAHPAGSWAVDTMPIEQEGIEKSESGRQPNEKFVEWTPVPIRATLVVAPATLLDQWQAEIARHAPALTFAVYAGLGPGSSSAVEPHYVRPAGNSDSLTANGAIIAGEPTGRKRRRVSATNSDGEPTVIEAPDRDREVRRPIIAACHSGMFVGAPTGQSSAVASATDEASDRSASAIGGAGDGRSAPIDVASCDIILASYETLRNELGSARSNFSVSPLEQLGFWRIVLDEAQLVSKTNSVAAQMAAHLWRRHAWVVTGTPISSSVHEIHGLLDFLGHEFGNKERWRTMLQEPFVKQCSPIGLCRMRALLRDVVLRRTKRQPHILKQMNLPPLAWHSLTMPLAPLERKAYDKAAAALSRSYKHFRPVIEGQKTLRKRAITAGGAAAGGAGRGFDGRNQTAKKYARFIGDVTRLRQTACHPQIVRRSDSMFGGKRLTMQEIMTKLIERERSSAYAAAVNCLRATIVEAIVTSAPANPNKGSRSDAVYLALWDVATWEKISAALDALTEEGVALQEEQRAQRQKDNDHERLGNRGTAGMDAKEEAPSDTTNSSETITEDDDSTDVTKAWAKLRMEVAALRKFITTQVGLVEAATDPAHAACAVTASQDGESRVTDNTDGSNEQSMVPSLMTTSPGSRGRATSAASRRARSRAAPPKLFAAALSFLRRPDGGKAASSSAVTREHRRAAALEHSLVHLRTRATQAKQLNVQRDPGAGGSACTDSSSLERQCPICLDVLECAWTVTPCGHEFCNDCIATHLDGTLAVASTPGRPCPVCRTPLRSSELFVVKGGAEEVEGANLVDEFGTKLARLVDEVKHASAKGEKCVVFSAWSRLLHLAGGALADQNIAFSSLAGSLEERKVALLRFRGNDSSKTISSATIVGVESSGVATDPKVLLVPLFGGSSGAGGGGAAGLTLTEANVAILLEPALQPGIEAQAIGRVHRLGQKQETRVLRLLVEDTIEQQVIKLQEQKMIQSGGGHTGQASELLMSDLLELVECRKTIAAASSKR